MKSNYQHIFSPLTVKNYDYQKPCSYDAYGNRTTVSRTAK